MSTAQKTKSTWSAIAFTSEAFWTVTPARFAGIAPLIAQRPFITSAYFWPAELALAASSVTSYQGWFSSRLRKRWPTMPVAPRTPTRSFFWLISAPLRGRSRRKRDRGGYHGPSGLHSLRQRGPVGGRPRGMTSLKETFAVRSYEVDAFNDLA